MPANPEPTTTAEAVDGSGQHHGERMSSKAWTLFAAMAVIWGLPYLFIKIGVGELSPPALVFGRTALALLLLLPIALITKSLAPALRQWRTGVLFGLFEMAIPWLLLTHAEMRISSGMTGLLIAATPIIGAIITARMGNRQNVAPIRIAGMALGMFGVLALVGIDAFAGHIDWLSALEVFIVAVCYATAPIMIDRQSDPAPAIGTITVSILFTTIVYAPLGIWGLMQAWPLEPETTGSLVFLGFIATALAFVLFFALIAEAGPVRAVVITYINPAVAILAGVLVLSEQITPGMLVGFPLVLVGSWLATRPTT